MDGMLQAFIKNKQVPIEFLDFLLEGGTSDRCFIDYAAGFNVYIVLKDISKHELKEFEEDLSVIFQNFDLPFLVLKYKQMSFEMPLIPIEKIEYSNVLVITIIDSNGFIVKHLRFLTLDFNLAFHIVEGFNSLSGKSKGDIVLKASKIYKTHSSKYFLSGGIRQRFERKAY
jgi:hypothetical protein